MANTLTNLIAPIVRAVDIVSLELTGLIPSVTMDASAEQVAVGQTIYFPIVGSKTAADVAAAATGPDPSDVTVGNDSMSITKSRSVTFYFTGEEQKGLGGMYDAILTDSFAQAMRTLANEAETDLAALYSGAAGAYGTAGTAPFGTAGDYTAASLVRKELVDRGAPLNDLQLVVDTAAGANIRGKQAQAQMAGETSMQRQGILLDINGFKIRESAAIKYHTAGTAASATTNNAGYSVGDTTITLASAGTGTILTGDVLSHARDTRLYVVKTGDADVSGGGTFVLNGSGLMSAVTAATSALTLKASYRANMAFARSAIRLLWRVPAMPAGGDAADDVQSVTHPGSGLSFQVAMYKQRRRIAFEVAAAWGVKLAKADHLALLIG